MGTSMRRLGPRRPPEHDRSSRKVERDAKTDGRSIAAGGIAREAQQAGSEGVSELADARREPDQHTESCGVELALDDEGRERDDVADREAVKGAGSKQGVG